MLSGPASISNPRFVRTWAGVIAGIAWFTLALQAWVRAEQMLAEGQHFASGYWIYVGYFTILTNLLTAVLMTSVAMGRLSPRNGAIATSIVTANTLYVVIVSVVYTLLLRGQKHFVGLEAIVDVNMHYAVPFLMLGFWLIAWPKAWLPLSHAAAWLIYPLMYCAGVLIGGAKTGWFPYPFVDANTIGWPQVWINCGALTAAFYALGIGAIALARVARPRHSPVSS